MTPSAAKRAPDPAPITHEEPDNEPLEKHTLAEQGADRPWMLVVFSLVLTLTLGLIYTIPLPGRLALEVGQPAASDIFAPEHFSYSSDLLTEQDRERARNNSANLVYDYDGGFVDLQRRKLVDILAALVEVRAGAGDVISKTQRIKSIQGLTLNDDEASALLRLDESGFSAFRLEALRVFDGLMRNGRIADDGQVESTRTVLSTFFSIALDPLVRQAGADMLGPLIGVNVILNKAATDARSETAANAVPLHRVEVQKGEVILRVGQIADALAIEKLERAGLRNGAVLADSSLAGFGMLAMLVLLLTLYIMRFVPELMIRRRQLLLIGLVMVLPAIGYRISFPEHAVWPYLLPVAAASMLVAVLLRANLALVITMLLSLMAVLFTQGNGELGMYYFVTGTIGVVAIWRADRSITFITSGIYVGLAGFVTAVLMHILAGQRFDLPNIGIMAAAAALNGMLAASVTFASFSVLGRLFGITTVLQLLELAHPTQPLLRRLMQEAPGTYHHSLVVSNLAERAAQLVGADPLLARVGAYYHDIGKVLNPYAFIDNQAGIENIHDRLDPVTSARIIREHVTEGYKLGVKNHLPRRILDCIAEHHGTTLIAYFYHKALQTDPNVDESLFRYIGPKPQTKETAILMLADSVEAAVRAAATNGGLLGNGATAEGKRSTVEDIIASIVSDRVKTGQLDECDLTLRDLSRIQEAFAAMLKGIYHTRIDYPPKPVATPTPALPATVESEEVPALLPPGPERQVASLGEPR